ncbi:extracellular catalytic domain type 1 short-chain-length polyhydroxyalkanoate depolymerase [Noviherbaspirillum sp.]|uniref:extracellular catalytic domain type 1 short-chain-length polyhydroxyalkanoate depolymerase n=1 Tax=Noviherbaspirillum sp. TaxID=1926288 RepID=UPI002FE2759A
MIRPVVRAIVLPLLVCFAATLPQTAVAEDGPVRQRLKERMMQRQQEKDGQDMDAVITRPGDHEFTIRHDGLQRQYRVHVPAAYRPATPMPLLVALHGGGGNMDFQADDERYGLIGKSESAGFIVVFPNGYSKRNSGRLATWNAGACCGPARDENIDDVGFIRRIVANLSRQMNIDRKRIYAAGMSNGGMMSYRLACEMSDVFRAIAPVAGTDNTTGCHPKRPVAVLHIHARDDSHVLFNGGAGPGVPRRSAVTEFASVPETTAKWASLNGCAAPPKRIVEVPGAYCDLYAACKAGTEVQLCVTETGGHSWPGAGKSRGDTPSQAINANDVMWEFFNRQ